MSRFLRGAIVLCTFAILVLTYGTIQTQLPYAAFGGLIGLWLLAALIDAVPELSIVSWIDWIPALYLISWLYGALLGAIYQNERVGIVRNFAGLTVYVVYYAWRYVRVPVRALLRTLAVSGLINAGAALFAALSVFLSFRQQPLSVAPMLGEQRLYYSTAIVVSMALIAPMAARMLGFYGGGSEDKRDYHALLMQSPLVTLLLFVGVLAVSTILTVSKGFTLGTILMVGSVVPIVAMREKRRRTALVLGSGMALAIFGAALWLTGALDVARTAFNASSLGNDIRYEQTTALLSEMSFWGHGLGARLQSGYTRDILGYGFEVSYINVVHKIGVVSILPFAGYAITVLTALAVMARRNLLRGAVALGAMSFLLPAIGNPLLISTTTSVLHCISLYILSDCIGVRSVRAERAPANITAPSRIMQASWL